MTWHAANSEPHVFLNGHAGSQQQGFSASVSVLPWESSLALKVQYITKVML